ncbi:MAG TPA: DUF2306 domain-containing protein [Thermoanaerobaculia bacterium]|nr:DUF2306 domain-containing protein [Thermoanaerobaculia bacterium]
MTKSRIAWSFMAFFALAIAGYGIAYVVIGDRMYSPQLIASFRARPWGIIPHALFGSTALICGALQFSRAVLRRRRIHRIIGLIYVIACLIVGTAGTYMAIYSYAGLPTHLGFGALGILLLITTVTAFFAIKRRDIATHREWMIRSYALIFAAVTLRVELPILIALFRDFAPAYVIVAWSCWVPNLLFAEMRIRATRSMEAPFVASLQGA